MALDGALREKERQGERTKDREADEDTEFRM